MQKTVLFFLFLVLFLPAAAQDGRVDIPFSWSLQLRESVIPIELPPLDLEAIHAEDAINDLDKSQPWRYGISRTLTVDIHRDGTRSVLENGDKIWRLAIRSVGAVNLSVNFDNFRMPNGGTLFLYNQDRTDVSRRYTASENSGTDGLGSWFVDGDVIIAEYYEPRYISTDVQLEIGTIIHGYRMGRVEDAVQRGLNDSGDCHYDVNCSVGSDFEGKKDVLKKTVALLNLGNGYLCSASLMNNTAEDKRPYLLTANHCLQNSNPSLWSVRFNWMSPNPICGTEQESIDLESNFTMSGAILRANNALSDFALAELSNPIPTSWDVSFAGWDRTDNLPTYEVGIHHPNGDIMKVCRDDSGAVRENANGTEVWLIGGVSVGSGDGWEIGTTESGSSGSPLFDQNGRVIGQLYAGQSFCDGTENNNDYDIYGRFAVSWNDGNTPETRLRDWLDPLDIGSTTIDVLQNNLSIQDNEFVGTLEVYPNPATDILTIVNNRYPNLQYRFYNMVGQEIMSGSLSNTQNTLALDALSQGVYFLYMIDEDSGSDITKKIIVEK